MRQQAEPFVLFVNLQEAQTQSWRPLKVLNEDGTIPIPFPVDPDLHFI
jgi:hypothetical protein